MAAIFILLTFVATFVGGLVGLRFKDRMHLLLGFTAGVLLAVVAFDLLPEIFELSQDSGLGLEMPMITLVLGFLIFHIAEKMLLIHHSHEQHYGEHKHPTVGVLSALALAAHSFLDGVAIGIGFQVSTEVGIAVAFAVLAHDFSDGLNTVSLMVAHKNSDKKALGFLAISALAPVLGGLSTLFFTLSDTVLLGYLGFFAGFLLYIGSSDILPEAHSKDSSLRTVFATVLGVVFIFLVTRML
ncbi:MAG: ZIP family metal transporter [Patescibacteria group bacterium]